MHGDWVSVLRYCIKRDLTAGVREGKAHSFASPSRVLLVLPPPPVC